MLTDLPVRMPYAQLAPIAESDGSLRWKLGRNCVFSPRQLMLALALVLLPSTLASVVFSLCGAPVVLLFNGLEVLAFAAAFVWYARSAGDSETVRVSQDYVEVAISAGASVDHLRLRRAFVAVNLAPDRDGLIRLTDAGRSVAVGRHVPRHLRPVLLRHLRAGMRYGAPAPTL